MSETGRWLMGVYSSTLPPYARHLAMIVADHASRGEVVWCGYGPLTQMTGLSRSSVRRGMQLLVEEGWLSVVESSLPSRPTGYALGAISAPEMAGKARVLVGLWSGGHE